MFTELTSILGHDLSHALGWTIVHSLWQVALIALAMSGIHRIYGQSAERRYLISIMAALSVVSLTIVTFALYYSGSIPTDMIPMEAIPTIQAIPYGVSTPMTIPDQISVFFLGNLDRINLIWGAGVILFALRMLASLCYIKYLRHTSYAVARGEIAGMVSRLQESLGINKIVQIAASAKISVPMVIGHVKPLILIPIGIVTLMEIDEIEAILIHEMSHIRRHDYLVNIVLTVVEIIYYFHPAMWWISANIKSERENCCDDAAIQHGIDPVIYAKALVRLEDFRKSAVPSLAIPFISNKHQLLNRIKRILNMEQTKNDIREKSVSTIFLLAMAILFSTTINSQAGKEIDSAQINTSKPEKKADSGHNIVTISGNDEIVIDVRDGVFSGLSMDGEAITEGEIVHQLRKSFSADNADNFGGANQTFYMKGNPRLEFKNNSFRMFGDESHITEHPKVLPTIADTLPRRQIVDDAEVTIIKQQDNKKIEITRSNGELTTLKIDGRVIPKKDYGTYQKEIDDMMSQTRFPQVIGINEIDVERFFPKGNIDSILSKSFGMIHDGENWRQFGGNLKHLLNDDLFQQLEDIEEIRTLRFEDWEDLSDLKNLKELKELRNFENLFESDHHLLSDSVFSIFRFDGERLKNFDWDSFGNLEALRDLQQLEALEDFDFQFDVDGDARFFGEGGNTVVDKIGYALQRDGLLEEYKLNKIELSGKHLKINGDKMPSALYNKYKDIYQESTGAPLTKSSKLVFEIKGDKNKRSVKKW